MLKLNLKRKKKGEEPEDKKVKLENAKGNANGKKPCCA